MADRVGQQLGNYRLVRLLGQSGIAEVYLGEHIHLGAQAAIKLLVYSDNLDRQKFQSEVRRQASLIHPHLVRILDFGIEGDIPFLALQYAPGGTLRQRLPKHTPLSPQTILPYIEQVADALHYLHDQKIVHGDVKPDNFLLSSRGDVLLSEPSVQMHLVTKVFWGTPYYVAPEQANEMPIAASDQYSLGVVAFEWLTGEVPFDGSNAVDIVVKHIRTPVPSLRDKVPTLPPELEQVVLTALAKDPKARFANVQAFATAFKHACQSAQPAARPASPPAAGRPAVGREAQAPEPMQPPSRREVPPAAQRVQAPDPLPTPARPPAIAVKPARTGAFISYSHKDKEHLEQLHAYLELYQQRGTVDVWDDTRIQTGTKWREQIKQALDSAKVAVLLISVDFLRSKFIKENELPPLITAALEEGIIILPIILDPCPFEEFEELAQLQTINPPSKPVIGMTAFEQKQLWNGVAKRIRDTLKG